MNHRDLAGFVILACLAIAGSGVAADKTPMSEEAAMQAHTAAVAPGAPHQHLATAAGTWDAVVKSWMDPAAPPMESRGTAEMTMILGGRYLRQAYKGEMMGMPYEGVGYTGYDNVQKKYVSTWFDNMGTGIMLSTGSDSGRPGVVTFTGSWWDPMTGKETTVEQVLTHVDASHMTFEMFGNGPDGKKMKFMEIHYTKKS